MTLSGRLTDSEKAKYYQVCTTTSWLVSKECMVVSTWFPLSNCIKENLLKVAMTFLCVSNHLFEAGLSMKGNCTT